MSYKILEVKEDGSELLLKKVNKDLKKQNVINYYKQLNKKNLTLKIVDLKKKDSFYVSTTFEGEVMTYVIK